MAEVRESSPDDDAAPECWTEVPDHVLPAKVYGEPKVLHFCAYGPDCVPASRLAAAEAEAAGLAEHLIAVDDDNKRLHATVARVEADCARLGDLAEMSMDERRAIAIRWAVHSIRAALADTAPEEASTDE